MLRLKEIRFRLHRPGRFVALAWLAGLCVLFMLGGCEGQVASTAQTHAQGAVVQQTQNPAATAPAAGAAIARDVYRNVPVLGELDRDEFDRSMRDLVAWVAPQQGCTHCHVEGDAASDAKPAKRTARRMLQMVQHINNDWKPHVGQTGVTCLTCHRGQPVPPQGAAVVDVAARSADGRLDLMRHMTQAVGLDCAQCHAPPGAADTPAALRQVAARGLRLLQDINSHYLEGARADCASCHQGRGKAADGAPLALQHAALMLPLTEPAALALAELRAAPSAPATDRCATAAATAARLGARLGAAQARRPVQGEERLTLYAAPDEQCAMLDLQMQPGETLEAFVSHQGYTSVRYRRVATGSEARGWVRNDRLGPGLAVQTVQTASATPAPTAAACAADPAPVDPAQPARGRGQVRGQGRLQFYSAPDPACPLRGIFILPGEPVETLDSLAGYTAVRYVNPRTGGQARGWVLSQRLSNG